MRNQEEMGERKSTGKEKRESSREEKCDKKLERMKGRSEETENMMNISMFALIREHASVLNIHLSMGSSLSSL